MIEISVRELELIHLALKCYIDEAPELLTLNTRRVLIELTKKLHGKIQAYHEVKER